MFGLIASGGFSVFGLSINPAMFAFFLIIALFGGMNLIEFKRFD